MTKVQINTKLRSPTKKQSAKSFSIPVARREFTTVECYTNVGSYGKGGHGEAVRQNREVCPIHLDMDSKDESPQMTMF